MFKKRASLSSKYRSTHTLEFRKLEADRIRVKYPDRIPIICEVAGNDEETIKLDKYKYLVPKDLTIGQFLFVLRKRIQLDAKDALFLFVNGTTLPPCLEMMNTLYNTHKNEDGFMYFVIARESTFG